MVRTDPGGFGDQFKKPQANHEEVAKDPLARGMLEMAWGFLNWMVVFSSRSSRSQAVW